MNVRYARVSTSSQSLENQIEQLKTVICEIIQVISITLYHLCVDLF